LPQLSAPATPHLFALSRVAQVEHDVMLLEDRFGEGRGRGECAVRPLAI
jgi:hypothetical protein